ncbi:MAG: chorismate synthase [Phycisphaerales bacterium]|nr:chorismate synthase [Phycisphaerales bacterium]
MADLTCQTAGESHGPALTALVNGLPAGLAVDVDFINAELHRRQGGYGRGGRQRIESDAVTMLAGVRRGVTTGAPVVMQIPNRDSRLDDKTKTPAVHRPRPGHADLAGSVKWLTTDCRDTLERASARETASRVAAGALARCLLREFGIETFGFVRSIHAITTDAAIAGDQLDAWRRKRDASEVYCPDDAASQAMIETIHEAKKAKDTVGGVVEAHVFGCPIGLGSCMNWHEKLDSRLAAAVMGIQAFKGVEIGLGFEATRRFGSQVHDPIEHDASRKSEPSLGFTRPTNNAGGLEGGMTNGMPIVVRGAMKPISTLLRGLPSVDLNTKQPEMSQYERSDICAVSAASVVMENVIAFEVARVLREKFAGDSLIEMRANYDAYLDHAKRLPLK